MAAARLSVPSRVALAALVAVCLGAAPGSSHADKVKDSDELNYILKIPDPYPYEFQDVPPQFREEKVDVIADWKLEKLADKEKTAGTGQGARVMLAVSDVPASLDKDYETWLFEYQTIETLAKSRDLAEAEAKRSEELKKTMDEALSKLAALPEVRGILLNRFTKDKNAWPALEEQGHSLLGGVEAVELSTTGTC